MIVTPKVARALQSLPDNDATAVLDTVSQVAGTDTSRRLVSVPVQLDGLTAVAMVGRPVTGEPVLLTLTLKASE